MTKIEVYETVYDVSIVQEVAQTIELGNVIEVQTSGGGNRVFNEVPTGAINGSNATFTTAFAFVPESLEVFINGLLQKRGAGMDYNNINSTTLVFSTSPVAGDVITSHYSKA